MRDKKITGRGHFPGYFRNARFIRRPQGVVKNIYAQEESGYSEQGFDVVVHHCTGNNGLPEYKKHPTIYTTAVRC